MRVLGLDTALAAVSVAVYEGDGPGRGQVLAREMNAMERGQSEALMPMVERVMADAGLGFADLDRVAVTRGPGAFTGIRIGLAGARGLGLAAGVPVVGVCTFAAIAAGIDDGAAAGCAVLVAIDTKRGDFYAALIAPDQSEEGTVLNPDDLVAYVAARVQGRAVLVAGDGAKAACAVLVAAGLDARESTAPPVPDAAHVAALGAGLAPDAAPPTPLYLRPPAVHLPGVGRVG